MLFEDSHGNGGSDLSKVATLGRLIEVKHARRIEGGSRGRASHGQKRCSCHQLFDHVSSLLIKLSIHPADWQIGETHPLAI